MEYLGKKGKGEKKGGKRKGNIGCPKKSYSIKVKQKVHRKRKMT